MGNDRIGLEETGTPDHYLDTDSQTIDTFVVHRERNQVAGIGEDDIAVVTDAAPTIETDHGIVSWAIPPYKEDDAAPANPYGMPFLMERDDALGGLTPIAGDWTHPFCSSNGELWVKDDGANSLLTTIDADTSSMSTDLGTVAGAVSGTEMQVDIVSSATLDVSGATVTVDLGANNDVTIDNSSIVHAEDAVHGSGDAGVMMLAVRQDSQVDFGADGDYVPLSIDANGAVRVTGGGGGTEYTEDVAAPGDPVGGAQQLVREDGPVSIAADGDWVTRRGTQYGAAYTQILDSSGNFIDSFGGSGGTSHADDAAFTIGSASSITPMGALADDTTPDSVDEGDVGVPRMTLDRKLLTRIVGATDGNRADVDSSGHLQCDIAASSATVNIQEATALDVSAATVTVDLGANNDVTIDNSSIVQAEDAVHGSGDAGIMSLAVRNDTLAALAGTDGDYAPLQVDASGALYIQEGSALDVSAATVTVDLGANNDVTIDASSVVGTEDAAAPADVVVLGGIRDDEVGSTAVTTADGDVTTLRTDKFGNLKVTQHPDATSEVKYAVIDHATSGDNEIVAAAGAGIKIRVLAAFMVANGDVLARFESGAGGTALTGQMDLTTNSGFVLPHCPVGWFETADNTALNLELDGAVSVDGSIVYVEV